ncbi:MAG: glycosyltransferase family 4 protein [Thermomicrobiales bacterium]|nr:glycosyltransferase family 4 protein [Thermomicrobiales bacterium]
MTTLPIDRRWADLLWFRARLPLMSELFAGRSDLVYSPDFTVPPSVRTPGIVTVHDLAFEVAPEFAPAGLRAYLQSVVPRQVRKAAAIAVVSKTTALDLGERYGVAPERMTLVSNGVDERFFNATPLTSEQRASLGIPEQYLLMVGTLEPRKNHLGAFEALLRSEVGRDAPLVVAGRRGWNDEPIVRRLGELEAAGRAIWIRYAPEALLPGLYAGALATIYPSWYEGFGLPALESLAAGTPLVTSLAPSLVEIAQGVARQADAGDPDALAAALDDAVRVDRTNDAQLKRNARANAYRWEPAGVALTRLIRRIAA